MNGPGPLRRVRMASTRVALISTAIVAAVYLVISLTVVLIVVGRLTAGVDSRVIGALNSAVVISPGRLGPQRTLGTPDYTWYVASDGTEYVCGPDGPCGAPVSGQALPASDQEVGANPQTVSVAGSDFRVVGASVPPAYSIETVQEDPLTGAAVYVQHPVTRVVVGESMATAESAEFNIILAESIIGPILLIAVFLGALTIGRRVAAPIELARLRQMEFTADASHELRTPLSVIEAQTSLALAEPRDPAWYRAAFQRVQGESGRIRRLVEDLLWLARFDTTRDRAPAEHVDVAILAHMAADRFGAVAEAKGIRLSVATAPVPLVISAPPEWLDRLLGVLLDNACKYVPQGGTIDVSVRPEGGRIRLSVDDSGPGIPAEQRPLIFDRFRRATEQPGGSGLGLAIADSVVSATGGRWLIGESAAGGASMGVSWPRSLTGAPEPEAPREVPSPAR